VTMRVALPATSDQYSAAMLRAGAEYGFGALDEARFEEGRALAARLMDCKVASAAVFASIRSLQPAVLLTLSRNERVSGFVATLLLRETARRELLSGAFDGLEPNAADLAVPGDEPAIYYIWGVGGDTHWARSTAMALCRRFREETLAALTAFTKAATADGYRAAVARLGFRPVSGVESNLLVSPPITGERAA
jgi:hypothetical protein